MNIDSIISQNTFTYLYLAGPVLTSRELDAGIIEGNCRLAVQLYFYRQHGIFLERDQIYLPGGYKTLGEFVFKEEVINFSLLKRGDVIYAQNIRNKSGDFMERALENFADYNEWLYHFHTAIYIGKISSQDDAQYVYHASSIENGPGLWTLEKFMYHYLPISVKRIALQ